MNIIADSLIKLNFSEKEKFKKICVLMYATCMWVPKKNRMRCYVLWNVRQF